MKCLYKLDNIAVLDVAFVLVIFAHRFVCSVKVRREKKENLRKAEKYKTAGRDE